MFRLHSLCILRASGAEDFFRQITTNHNRFFTKPRLDQKENHAPSPPPNTQGRTLMFHLILNKIIYRNNQKINRIVKYFMGLSCICIYLADVCYKIKSIKKVLWFPLWYGTYAGQSEDRYLELGMDCLPDRVHVPERETSSNAPSLSIMRE